MTTARAMGSLSLSNPRLYGELQHELDDFWTDYNNAP